MTEKNSILIAETCAQRIAGLREHVSPKTDIVLNTKRHKLGDVLAIYQASLDARAALVSKRNEVKVALQQYKAAEAARRKTEKVLARWVLTHLGDDTQAAHDIGFAPRPPGQATVATKQGAIAQAKATREARHTMGKKEKLKIKGALPPPAPDAGANPEPRLAPPADTAPPPTNGTTPPSLANGAGH